MNSTIAVGIVLLSGLLAATSQIMLKISANRDVKYWLQSYLNGYVIGSYAILLFTFFMNAFAMRFLPYKSVPILSSVSYVFVLAISRMVFKETLSARQTLGTVLILLGICIFNL